MNKKQPRIYGRVKVLFDSGSLYTVDVLKDMGQNLVFCHNDIRYNLSPDGTFCNSRTLSMKGRWFKPQGEDFD